MTSRSSSFVRVGAAGGPRRLSFAAALVGAALSLGLAACGGAAGAGAQDASGANPLIGAPAPEFAAELVTGEGPASLQESNGKIVIVDFWATFCEPCKKSFPKYQELVDQFGGEVAVVAVSVDEPENASKEQIEEFARNTGVKFPILWDKTHAVAEKYKPPTMPTSFVIDKQGIVRHVHAGYKAGEENALSAEIKALLGK